MDRRSKITHTRQFIKDFPYYYDTHNHFMEYWMHPFLDKVYNSRKEAYDAIDVFIVKVKTEFKKYDYGNYVIQNISEKWFEIKDYKEPVDDYYYYRK